MTGLARWARLSFRLQRWEVVVSLVGVALLAGVMFWVAWQLRTAASIDPGCPDPQAHAPGCEALAQRFQGLADWGTGLLFLSWGAPFALGLVFGVPIVAREVESRTAEAAWTLARSRIRWLISNVVFSSLVLVALLIMVVVASGRLAAAIQPTVHFERDFSRYGQRDWLIVARGVGALGIGLLAGAAIGRVLTGLLVAGVASILIFAGITFTADRWNESLAVVVDPHATADGEPAWEGALGLGGGIELPSGEVVSYSDIEADVQYGDETGALFTRYDEEAGRPDPESFVGWERSMIVPGRQYPAVLARDSAVTVGIGLLALGASAAVVRRRSPR